MKRQAQWPQLYCPLRLPQRQLERSRLSNPRRQCRPQNCSCCLEAHGRCGERGQAAKGTTTARLRRSKLTEDLKLKRTVLCCCCPSHVCALCCGGVKPRPLLRSLAERTGQDRTGQDTAERPSRKNRTQGATDKNSGRCLASAPRTLSLPFHTAAHFPFVSFVALFGLLLLLSRALVPSPSRPLFGGRTRATRMWWIRSDICGLFSALFVSAHRGAARAGHGGMLACSPASSRLSQSGTSWLSTTLFDGCRFYVV